jgi:predicted metal-dependent peptidase
VPTDRHSITTQEDRRATPDTDRAAARALATARARLILGRDAASAFFATLILRLVPSTDRTCPTAATDGRRLLYNPEFLLGLSMDERVGVLVHEVMHCALAHHARRAGRDLGMWNVACDLAINPIVLAAGFALPAGRLVPGEGPFAGQPAGKSAEEYYARLREQSQALDPKPPLEFPTSTDGTDGGSNPNGPADPGKCGGVIEPVGDLPSELPRQESDWRQALARAEQVARGRGDLPAGLGLAVAVVLHPPADWRAILRSFVSAHARHDYSWSRPNRRYLAHGLFLPGLHSEELGDIIVAVDTSGSVGSGELGLFATELTFLLDVYECRATILYHDRRIQKVQSWSPADGPLAFDPVGGGGTCHRCVFDWIEETVHEPVCAICLTDLQTRFPDRPPAFPVLWAKIGDAAVVPPFGSVVPIG